jgi:phosphate:Na+ symporter
MISTASGPLREARMLPAISAYLADDYVTAFLIGALFTWLIHSSVASILMLAAFATQGVLGLEALGPMILGANLGGGLIAFWLTRGTSAAAQRVAIGNLIFRGLAAIGVLVAFEAGLVPLGDFAFGGGGAGSAVVNFHVLFNLGLVVVGLPFVGLVAQLCETVMPDPAQPSALEERMGRRVSVLDRSVVDNPNLALASVTRELLRMGELVELMLRPLMELFEGDDRPAISRVRKIDKEVNRAHTNIKLYLAEVSRGKMTEEEARRSVELTNFAINLEHAGDIVSKLLLPLADERAEKGWRFSDEGLVELSELHNRLLDNAHLALNVLISQDRSAARQLVAEKERMRDLARKSQNQHLLRLQRGTAASIETSSMHLEVARGLKEMNSLLVTVAYPLLSRSGDLLESRLAVRGDLP